MEKRIYTKAEKEASWKEKGLIRLPRSDSQGRLAVAAREFVEGLKCRAEVHRMVAVGKRPSDVAKFIQEERGEMRTVTFGTVRKYLQVYRTFFIPLFETLRAKIDEKTGGDVVIVRRRLEMLLGKIPEIERLEEVIKLQLERIQEQRTKEQQLGLPFPGIRLELELLLQFAETLIDKKIELGYPGYQRVPQRVDIRGQLLPAPGARLDLLTPEDRERLIEFGTTIQQMIEMSMLPGNGRGNC